MPILHSALPSKEEAINLLCWAHEQNPGPWTNHCMVVGRAAETIASYSGLDTHRAYVSGILHDIGRFEGVRHLRHTFAGYKLLKEKGYHDIAEICLSHSFPCQNIKEYFGENDCTTDELAVITTFLTKTTYNDYDKLIQLCDAIGAANGVCIIEIRLMDVIKRYGTTEHTPKKLDSIFALKKYFDTLCKTNIYNLFHNEIANFIFQEK